MELTILNLAGIVFYFLATAVFAYFTRRTRTFSEFSVGNRSVPAAMIFASLSATIIGPGFSVGFTGEGYTSGYLYYFLALSYGVQTVLAGLLFAPRLNTFDDCHTIGDVMAIKYGPVTRLLTGLISVGLCIGFTAVMGKVAGTLLHEMTGWGLLPSIASVTMLTALFTFTGGVRAVIATDAMHFSWYTLVIPIMLVEAFFKKATSSQALGDLAVQLTGAGLSTTGSLKMLGVAVSFFLGETLIPPYTNRALAARSSSASKLGFVGAGLFCLVWLPIVASLGICAHLFLPSTTPPDDVLVALGRTLLPPGIFGLLLAAIVAIVMSSQESVLNSGAVAFVRDVVDAGHTLSDSAALRLSRWGTVGIALTSVVVSVYSPSIIDGLLICYSVWAPTVLIPLLLALYLKKTVNLAGWLSILSGGTVSILWQTVLKEPAGIPAILVGILANLIGYGIGHTWGKWKMEGVA